MSALETIDEFCSCCHETNIDAVVINSEIILCVKCIEQAHAIAVEVSESYATADAGNNPGQTADT